MSDLDTSKLLRDRGKYSQAIYQMQQSFEKSIKAVYCFTRIKYDMTPEPDAYQEAVRYRHNTKKSTLDFLVKISDVEEKILLGNLTPDKLKDPRYHHLTKQLKPALSGYRDKVKNLATKMEPPLETILKRFPKFVGEKYQKYESNICLIKKRHQRSYHLLIFQYKICLRYPTRSWILLTLLVCYTHVFQKWRLSHDILTLSFTIRISQC